MSTNYAKIISPENVSQIEQLDSNQVKNNAGGFVYELSNMKKVKQFLVLGAESNSYYSSQKKLVKENATNLLNAIKNDGVAVVNLITEVSESAVAAKNDSAIFALSLCVKYGNDQTRQRAYSVVSRVCRIGTHLFTFMENLKQLGKGESRGLRSSLLRWYTEKTPQNLAYQLVKYQNRNGWTHKDVLRLAHPKGVRVYKSDSPSVKNSTNDILYWSVNGWPMIGENPPEDSALNLIWAHEKAHSKNVTVNEVCDLITTYKLPFEAVPTEFLKEVSVWNALIPHMGGIALIRNLARMTANGTLKPLESTLLAVTNMLTDQQYITKSKVHPINVLSALMTYKKGKGDKGSLTWTPISQILDALDKAFYLSFKNVEPSNKRFMLSLDVSGSMSWSEIAGISGLTPRLASAAMAMVTASVEPAYMITTFSCRNGNWQNPQKGDGINPVFISPSQRLDNVLAETEKYPPGGTDCSLPMLYAMENNLNVDCFVIYTDSETYAGRIHPMEALKQYRKKSGILDAKLIVVGMISNGFSIADPNDPNCLDVVGFDSSAVQVMSEFAKGNI